MSQINEQFSPDGIAIQSGGLFPHSGDIIIVDFEPQQSLSDPH